MNDKHRFEQQLEDELRRQVGPIPQIDSLDVARTVSAGLRRPQVRPHPRWSVLTRPVFGAPAPAIPERGFSMFSALKLIAAGLVVSGSLVVGGLFQSGPVDDTGPVSIEASSPPIEEPTVPAWVTGITGGHKVIGSGGRRWLEGRTTYPEEVVQADQMSSDPRMEGTLTITYNLHELGLGDARTGGAVAGGALTAGIIRLETDDGSWQGAFSGLREPDEPWSHRLHALLEGEGGYEGLRALLLYDGSMGEGYGHGGSQVVEGFIFEGPVPEVPTE